MSWVESGKDFLYYHEGISDTIGKYIMKMDDERIGIGKVIGLKLGEDLFDINTQYDIEYHVKGNNLSDIVRGVDAYKGIYGPKTMKTRYIYEDIPMGLVPIAEIGKLVNKPVENIELIIELGEKLLNEDFKKTGRNLKNLGLEGMTGQQIVEYAESGEKA